MKENLLGNITFIDYVNMVKLNKLQFNKRTEKHDRKSGLFSSRLILKATKVVVIESVPM